MNRLDAGLTELISQYALLRRGLGDDLAPVAVAIAVEDALGVVIPDEMIDAEHLGSADALRDLLVTMGAA